MFVLLIPIAIAAPAPLSVEEAVARAMAQASDYQAAKDDEDIAADEARSAGARLLPAVGAEATVIYNSPGAGTPGTQSFLSENSVLWYRATAGATGTLFGGLGAQLKADKALVAAAHAGTEVARRDLAQATIDAYYGVVLANAQDSVAMENRTAADELARVTALRFAAGEVPEVDVLRTRMLAAQRADERLQAQVAVDAANSQLGVLIGGDSEWQVAALDGTRADLGAVEALATANVGTSRPPAPSVAAAEAQVDAANASVGAARAEFLPQVEYMVGYGFDTDTLGSALPQHLGVTAGITLSVPIFDWGIGARSVDAAKLSAHQAELARDQAERGERADLAIAVSTARSAARRSEGLAAVLSDAERNVAISQARYSAGEADLLEVTEAQQTLVDTRYASNTALAEYQSALGHLRLLAGQ